MFEIRANAMFIRHVIFVSVALILIGILILGNVKNLAMIFKFRSFSIFLAYRKTPYGQR